MFLPPPLQVRICTGKNTTLKFSERKEHSLTHSKRKKKNNGTNGHSHHELHKITSPVDIYRYGNTPHQLHSNTSLQCTTVVQAMVEG